MKVSSIQSTNPSFNGIITVKNVKTGSMNQYYTDIRTDKDLLKSFGKLYNIFPLMDTFFKESMKQEKSNRLVKYFKQILDITNDETLKSFIETFNNKKSNILQLAAEYKASSQNEHFSKLSIDDLVVIHSADIKYKNIE